QTNEALLIKLRRTFREDTWTRRLHVETRQTKRAADQIQKREKPGEPVQLGPFDERRSITPNIRQHRRRNPKRHDISNRIELNTDLSSCFGESCDTAVEHVKQKCKADRDGSVVEVRCC